MFPIIYTPTEGDAIAGYSGLFRKPEGCFLNIRDKEYISDNLGRWGEPDDIDLIVVSDGEQVRPLHSLIAHDLNAKFTDSWNW